MTGLNLAELAVASGSAGGIFGLALVAVRWTANFIAGRLDRKEAQVDAGMQKLFAGLQEEVGRLSEECVKLRERADATENDLRECRDEHAKCEARVQQLEATFQGYGDARAEAQRIIAEDHAANKRRDGE